MEHCAIPHFSVCARTSLRATSFVSNSASEKDNGPAESRRDAGAGIGAGSVQNKGRNVVAGIALTNPDKVLYPEKGLTKRDLARYYAEIAEWMIPHCVIGR
jgi:bifunctional non-homologous end joining protein LigD